MRHDSFDDRRRRRFAALAGPAERAVQHFLPRIPHSQDVPTMAADKRPARAKPYHHGDLRAALLEVGLQLLSEQDADTISMREIARRVGVSATAVYRHFPDKQRLLAAIARHGLDALAKAQHRAWDEAGGGEDGFAATGRAYVRFAIDNPALFRLIFSHHPRPSQLDGPPGRMPEALAFLLANATMLAPPGIEARRYALQFWALGHGLAMLALEGQIPADEATLGASDIRSLVDYRPVDSPGR